MKKLIHHLRRKPEHVRRHILHVSTMVAGGILALLWVISLGTTLSSPETKIKVSNDLQPFSALKDNFVGGYQSISEPAPTDQTSPSDPTVQ
ncbi:MAG: hypothetical protein ABIS26_02400 [Candidatus Paceibacterota bacterium]